MNKVAVNTAKALIGKNVNVTFSDKSVLINVKLVSVNYGLDKNYYLVFSNKETYPLDMIIDIRVINNHVSL